MNFLFRVQFMLRSALHTHSLSHSRRSILLKYFIYFFFFVSLCCNHIRRGEVQLFLFYLWIPRLRFSGFSVRSLRVLSPSLSAALSLSRSTALTASLLILLHTHTRRVQINLSAPCAFTLMVLSFVSIHLCPHIQTGTEKT